MTKLENLKPWSEGRLLTSEMHLLMGMNKGSNDTISRLRPTNSELWITKF